MINEASRYQLPAHYLDFTMEAPDVGQRYVDLEKREDMPPQAVRDYLIHIADLNKDNQLIYFMNPNNVEMIGSWTTEELLVAYRSTVIQLKSLIQVTNLELQTAAKLGILIDDITSLKQLHNIFDNRFLMETMDEHTEFLTKYI